MPAPAVTTLPCFNVSISLIRAYSASDSVYHWLAWLETVGCITGRRIGIQTRTGR